ncbi:hypothetical protein, partial [Citrobacter youngae]|uniref:hypothetical protein n=1 Tax=Citrobacter youngae TaxID=133448 RepID=UPI001954448C
RQGSSIALAMGPGMQRARPAGILRYFGFSAYWFGFNFHWTLILLFLMPADILRFVGQERLE